MFRMEIKVLTRRLAKDRNFFITHLDHRDEMKKHNAQVY